MTTETGPSADELAGVRLFSEMPDEQRVILSQWFETEEFHPGRVLAEQGEAGYAFYVIKDGTAQVTVDGVAIRTLAAGDFFGEISILLEGRRTATVTATSEITVWSLFGTRFRQLQHDYPEAAATITAAAQARREADG